MTSLTRWKLGCALFAAIAGVSVVHARRGGGQPVQAETSEARGGMPAAFRRPIRVTAQALGVSEDDLVARIRSARSMKDLTLLCGKLAAIGDDSAIDTLEPMLGDARPGVPQLLLSTFAQIGSDHAIDVLVTHASDARPQIRTGAITALGQTESARAEQTLLAVASKPGDPAREEAIDALGALGSDAAIAKLVALVGGDDRPIALDAARALAASESPAAAAALGTLVDSADTSISAAAISGLVTFDDAMLVKLAGFARKDDLTRGGAALAALGRAGAPGLPVLRELATTGPSDLRVRAVMAIATVGGDDAVAALGEVLKTGDRSEAVVAARGLAQLGGDQARELLIESALSDRAQVTDALVTIQEMTGDDIDQALLSVVKQGTPADRLDALPRLLKAGNAEALQLAVQMAQTGSRDQRDRALRLLGQVGTPGAYAAELELARTGSSEIRASALGALVASHPRDPAIAELLQTAVSRGDHDEQANAITMLGKLGTDDARRILIGVMQSGKDDGLAASAASALVTTSLDADTKASLLAAATSNRGVREQVMVDLVGANDPDGLRIAREMIEGGDSELAARAVAALGENGTSEGRALVDRALDSTAAPVRLAAMQMLGNRSDDASTERLVGFLQDSDPAVRIRAMQMLGQDSSQRAQDAVLDAARTGSSEQRAAAVAAFDSLDDPRASQQLPQLMTDSDPAVAQAAIDASYSAGPSVDAELVRITEDANANSTLRIHAAQMLQRRSTELDPTASAAVADVMKTAPPDQGDCEGDCD